MRTLILVATCSTGLVIVASASSHGQGQSFQSYKSRATIGRNYSSGTPSFSAPRTRSPGLPMGATGSAVSPWLNPGSVVGGSGYYPSRPSRPSRPSYPDYRPGYPHYGQPGYRPGIGHLPEYAPPAYRPPGHRPGYRPPGYYPPGRYPVVIPYYSRLHYHWRPTCWTRPYLPVYYNYGYTVSGTWLGVGGATIQYLNPFVVPTAGYRYFDYTQPIRPPLQGGQEGNEDLVRSERAMQIFDKARQSFRRGDAFQAEKLVDAAIGLLPNDPTLHQFRALVLFSQQRYQEAAAVLYSVLAVSPGWDSATITSLYGSIDQYLMQVNQLAQYAATHPEAVNAQFLLAYHYATKGDSRAALRQLQRVQQARPNDRVVASLMNAIAG